MVRNIFFGDYINMLRSGLICNFPITSEAVTIANTIFGPVIATFKGETTRKSSDPVITDYVETPHLILDLNKAVTLEADMLFVNGAGLFVRAHRRIKFTTLEYIPSRTKGKLGNSLRKVISLYNASGFKIRTSLMDRDINCLIPDFPEFNNDHTTTIENVPEIKR